MREIARLLYNESNGTSLDLASFNAMFQMFELVRFRLPKRGIVGRFHFLLLFRINGLEVFRIVGLKEEQAFDIWDNFVDGISEENISDKINAIRNHNSDFPNKNYTQRIQTTINILDQV